MSHVHSYDVGSDRGGCGTFTPALTVGACMRLVWGLRCAVAVSSWAAAVAIVTSNEGACCSARSAYGGFMEPLGLRGACTRTQLAATA